MVAELRGSAIFSIVRAIVLLFVEEIIDVVRSISQERIQQRIVEDIGKVPDPQVQEHLVEVTEVIPQDDCNKVFAEELEALADVTETSAVEGDAYSLSQMNSSIGVHTTVDLKGFEAMTMVKRLG